jgi:RNA polymerase sigma factor (sigma-70 family)
MTPPDPASACGGIGGRYKGNSFMQDMVMLIEPLIPALRRYARGLLRDRAAADDLVQDCLERAIGKWHQRRTDSDARRWIFAIMHNLAINRLRQLMRRGRHVTLDDVDEATFARPATQEDTLRHRDLMAALEDLPEEQRSVLLLVSVEDMSYAETAEILGIPIGTVMSRLARARNKVSVAMEGSNATPARRPSLRRVK